MHILIPFASSKKENRPLALNGPGLMRIMPLVRARALYREKSERKDAGQNRERFLLLIYLRLTVLLSLYYIASHVIVNGYF